MAKAGAKTGIRNPGVSHGVCVGVFPCRDPDPHVELQRSASTNHMFNVGFETLAVIDVQSGDRVLQYRDALPPSTVEYHYRARSVRPEYTASTWTATVHGTPTNLPPGDLPLKDALTDMAIVAVSTARTIAAGTWAPFTFDVEYSDAQAMHVASSSKITIKYPGRYRVTADLFYTFSTCGLGTWVSHVLSLRHNTTDVATHGVYASTVAAHAWGGSTYRITFEHNPAFCSTGDYFDVYHTGPGGAGGGGMSLSTRSVFSVRRIQGRGDTLGVVP